MRGAVRRRLGERDDSGAATLFVVGLSVMLLVVAGLVVDGGLAINARSTAFDIAEQAARAGATQVDVEILRDTGRVVVDRGAAEAEAGEFLARALDDEAGGTPTIIVNGNEVTVEIRDRTVRTALLGLIGRDSFTVNAQATARAAVGIEDEIGGPP
jgi:Flp pilus assembly protein TadG